MNLILLLLRSSRAMVTLAILSAVLSGAANTGLLALLNDALASFGQNVRRDVFVFFGFCVLTFALRLVAENILIRMGQKIIFDLRMELCRRILQVKLRRLEQLGPHRILSTLTEDIPAITGTITLLPTLSFGLSVVVTCFAYLIYLSPVVFLATLAFLLLGILAYQLPVIYATHTFRDARQISDQLYDRFEALIGGLKELKLHRSRRQDFLERALQGTAMAYREKNVLGYSIFTVASGLGQLIAFMVLGGLVLILPSMMEVEKSTLVGYVVVFLYVLTPLQDLMNAVPNLNRASVALERIEQTGLDLQRDSWRDAHLEGPIEASSGGWEKLELRGVTHAYRREGEAHDFVLGPIDFTIEPGELLFIVGGNGSGKTTLAKVLVGLYEPASGQILLDGEPVAGERLEAYRQLFTAVFSDFHLFEEFLGLATPQLDEQARQYLEKLELAHKVTVENGQLSTTELSQGQRKRLALLTAYLEDRPIYLFDEWAADQDPVFKSFFYRVLLPELRHRGKTVVVISHDDAYFDAADRVVGLDYGQIVDRIPGGSTPTALASQEAAPSQEPSSSQEINPEE